MLSAPARMTLRASVAAASTVVPSCVYYNVDTGSWDTAGIATESIAISMDEGDEGNRRVDVNVTCTSFHLSDFTISSDDVDAAFRPVMLVRKLPLEKKYNSPMHSIVASLFRKSEATLMAAVSRWPYSPSHCLWCPFGVDGSFTIGFSANNSGNWYRRCGYNVPHIVTEIDRGRFA